MSISLKGYLLTQAKKAILKIITPLGYTFMKVKDTPRADVVDVFSLVVTQWLRLNRTNPYIVQVGANDGIQCDPVREIILKTPGCHATLLEPLADIYNKLQANYLLIMTSLFRCGKIKLVHAAIGLKDGEAEIFRPKPTNPLSSGDKESMMASFDKCTVDMLGRGLNAQIVSEKVQCMTWRSLFANSEYPRVDILVIDTEGMDCLLIRELINTTDVRPAIIQFEHYLVERDEFEKTCKLLEQHDYALLQVDIDLIAVHKPTVGGAIPTLPTRK